MAEKRRATTRRKRGRERGKKRRTEGDKRRGRTNSKVGEGAFSDEIRSRGRSEFGYLIHEGGKNGIERSLRGRVTAGARTRKCARLSRSFYLSLFLSPSLPLSPSLFLPAATAANGITRIPHFKRRFIHPTSAGWDELTIDRIDTVSAGEPRVRPGWKRVFRPRLVASIFLAKLHPSPPPRSPPRPTPRSLTLLSLFSITRLLRREEEGGGKRVMRRDRQSSCFFMRP